MRIAIIEEDESIKLVLEELTQGSDWNVDYYASPADFGRSNLSDYDVIISDYDLPGTNGRDLIKSISYKTAAQLFLIGNSFKEEDIHNNRIKGLIDKRNIMSIKDQLKYIDAKLRINHMLEEEQKRFDNIIPTNGFHIMIEDDIFFLDVTELLSDTSRNRIEQELHKSGLKKLVVSVSVKDIISSTFLGTIIYFYKLMKDLKGIMVFLNGGNEALAEQMKLCNLSVLFPIVNSRAEAKKILQ